jgi:membrane protein YdbS with pleckstrin-like domain
MPYLDNNRIEGEKVLYHAHLHWIALLKHILIVLLLIAAALTLLYFASQTASADNADLMKRISYILISISIIPIAAGAIKRSSGGYAVTNKRVVVQTGAMFLNKIESIDVEQTTLGRMLGYGTVVIRGVEGSLEPFTLVESPLEFKRQIEEQSCE